MAVLRLFSRLSSVHRPYTQHVFSARSSAGGHSGCVHASAPCPRLGHRLCPRLGSLSMPRLLAVSMPRLPVHAGSTTAHRRADSRTGFVYKSAPSETLPHGSERCLNVSTLMPFRAPAGGVLPRPPRQTFPLESSFHSGKQNTSPVDKIR